MDGVQMSQPTSGAYYTQQQSNIVVSPTSVSGGVGEVLSNTERTLQSWKHSLYVHDFCWCCCKREVKRFELEVSSERVTNVITEFSKACCSDPVPTVSYETVYLPHVVGMSMGHAGVLQSACCCLACCMRNEESKPCCCDPNQTAADWLHLYTTSSDLQIRAFLPISVFPTIRVAVASAKAPVSQAMH